MKTRLSSLPRLSLLCTLGLLASTSPASAHHAMDGGMPTNAFEGFVSGLAHPVIGLDHLAVLIAAGLLAAVVRPGLFFAGAFVIATMAGTGIHLLGVNIPGSETLIAGSVLLFGIILAVKRTPGSAVLLSLAGLVGALHGYAYGEAIFGAQTGPLIAYIAGFACIQMAVAAGAFFLGKAFLLSPAQETKTLRPAGLILSGFGLALVSLQIVSMLVPAV